MGRALTTAPGATVKALPFQLALDFLHENREGELKPGRSQRAFGLYSDSEPERLLAAFALTTASDPELQKFYTHEGFFAAVDSAPVNAADLLIEKALSNSSVACLFTADKTDSPQLEPRVVNDSLVYEWHNPGVGFYIYRIESTAREGYYIGRKTIWTLDPTPTDCQFCLA